YAVSGAGGEVGGLGYSSHRSYGTNSRAAFDCPQELQIREKLRRADDAGDDLLVALARGQEARPEAQPERLGGTVEEHLVVALDEAISILGATEDRAGHLRPGQAAGQGRTVGRQAGGVDGPAQGILVQG